MPRAGRSEPEILTDPVTRTVYATDNSIYQVEPHGVALPRTAAEVRALVRANAARPTPRPIVARGGGTGTNGQSLTDGLVIDVKRRMNRLLSVDPRARTVVVEPGMVTARLNEELATGGLFWAPHTSTLNRATVGGMISTDAAGKGSLVHGRAHRHVAALDVVLDDGTSWTAAPIPVAEAQARSRADDRIGRLWRALLDLPIVEGQDHGFPELARGFSGYGIDRFRRQGLVDPVALLCGAEGTLAIITGATLSLTPIPSDTVLAVASYDSFAAALDDSVDLAVTGPTAIESFDETTLERGRSSPAWPALGAVVGDRSGSVLLLEYSGDEPIETDPIEAALAATGRSRAVRIVHDAEQQAAAWKVRADAVGLLAKVATGGPGSTARPTAFVEDCAVPVAEMGAFIAGFRDILDGHGLTYGMFGHADVGCVHVRPALDLTDPRHERLVRRLTDEVVALVAAHGGVLWGEHGRGFRGDTVESFLDPATIRVMEGVKAAFDPNDRFNPGKLYRPAGHGGPAVIGLDEPPLRGQRDRAVPVAVRRELADAFACNGNGLCHHYGGAEVMCPSYKVTGDPALSPKGRADLLRAWSRRSAAPFEDTAAFEDAVFEDTVADNLHRCLSCSACTGHCPVEVDIPELKSRFLEAYYRTRRRPISHAVLARFEQLAMAGTRLSLPRSGRALAGRLLGLVDLPAPRPVTRGRRHRLADFGPETEADLVLLPDVFSAALDPDVAHRAADVLTSLGYRMAVAPFVPSGKFDYVKGRRTAFAAAAEAQAGLVDSVLDRGATPVVIEPAVALLHHHEYPAVVADYPSAVRHLVEVIDERRDRLPAATRPRPVTLLGHCTERATAPGSLPAWSRVLEAVGHSVTAPAVGCCGMAGIFGHERENQEMSRALWDLSWAADVEAAATTGTVTATGYSCRSQTARFTGRWPSHPIHLL